MGSNKSKAKDNKKKKKKDKPDKPSGQSTKTKSSETKTGSGPSPPPKKTCDNCDEEVACSRGKYFSLKVDLLVSFNKCFTGFLAEIPHSSMGPSSHGELCSRIKSGDNYKYLMSCPFRDNQMNTCLQDFCCRKCPITITRPCPNC